MKTMGTKFAKGIRQRKVIAVAMLLAVLLAVTSVLTTAAAPSSSLKAPHFAVNMKSDTAIQTTNPTKTKNYYTKTGSAKVTTDDPIKLSEIFPADMSKGVYNKLKRIDVTVSGLDNVKVVEDTSSNWEVTKGTQFTYTNSSNIDYSLFNTEMGMLSLEFDSSRSKRTGSVTVTVTGYQNTKKSDDYIIGPAISGTTWCNKTVYTCKISFYDYATATLDPDTLEVDFANKDTTLTTINPDNSGMGTASFEMKIANQGGGTKYQVGYRIKKVGEQFTTSTPITIVKTINRKTSSGYQEGVGTINVDTGVVTNAEPIRVTVNNLEPNTEYEVQGVVVTDGHTDGFKETAKTVKIKYTEPVINNFNIDNQGQVAAIGGYTKNISATIRFDHDLYDNKTFPVVENPYITAPLSDATTDPEEAETTGKPLYTEITETTGPALRVSLFFTENFTDDGIEDSETTRKKDTSSWKLLGTPVLVPATARQIDIPFTHKLDTIDRNRCAYKLEVTDVVTGYTVYKFSAPFILDHNPPSTPSIMATVGETEYDEAALSSGELAVGGANNQVDLRISGSVDGNGSGQGSQLKEYSYSTLYLSSDYVNSFITTLDPGTEPSNANILAKLATLQESTKPGYVEYTAWTSLEQKTDINGAYSTLTVAKDGFYAVHVRAVDHVEKTSDEVMALFRVDINVPTTPEVRLVQVREGVSGITVADGALAGDPRTLFEGYDNRTYSERQLWLFTKSTPQTGKTIAKDTYQYSTDGGLTWNNVSSGYNFVNKASLVDGQPVQAVEAYTDDTYTTQADFPYDVGFEIGHDIGGFQSIIVRVTDTVGNTSAASKAVEMRTSDKISASAKFAHEGVDVAMAMGNTNISTTGLTADLKNRVARKINEQYYGKLTANSSADPASPYFNPLALLATKGSGNVWTFHQCNWGSDPACAGACHDANCPYASSVLNAYSIFTPAMVNVQGLSSSSANDTKVFKWVKYDHSHYVSSATVGYVSDNRLVTNLQPQTTGGYYDKRGQLFTASQDRVIYMNQNVLVAKGSNDKPVEMVSSQPGDLHGKILHNNTKNEDFGAPYLIAYGTYFWAGSNPANTRGDSDSETRMGQWKFVPSSFTSSLWTNRDGSMRTVPRGSSSIFGRLYHMVDMTTKQTDGSTVWSDHSDPTKLTMSEVYGFGYSMASYRDFIFLYNNQSTKKEIAFTIDDSQLWPHANDGYGFLFNTTIRQGKRIDSETGDHEWRISGYMFFIGNPHRDAGGDNWQEHHESRYFGKSETFAGYEWYILKLDDLNLEYFCDGTINQQGSLDVNYAKAFWQNELGEDYSDTMGAGNTGHGATNGVENLTVKTKDDLAKNLIFFGHNSANDNQNLYAPHVFTGSNGYDHGTVDANGNPVSPPLTYCENFWTNPETGREELFFANFPAVHTPRNTGIYQLAHAYPDAVDAAYVRNFRMIIDNGVVEIYMWNTGTTTKSLTELNAEWNKANHGAYQPIQWRSIANGTLSTAGYPRIDGRTGAVTTKVPDSRVKNENGTYSTSKVAVPRPVVDNVQVGSVEAKKASLHTDTNCYGFGPIVSNRSYWHGCTDDTLVVFSNISMTMDAARSLSEVAAQPRWGENKAKYILNLSDDSESDFNTPVISANIQWRLLNDEAKFIGWGAYDNKAVTDAFIDRLQGEGYGFYQATEVDDINYAPVPEETQIENICDYICEQYYVEHSLDDESGSSASQILQTGLRNKGAVYTLDEAKKMTFTVSPEEYNTTTANEDYPAGRWYFVHDTLGYKVSPIARNQQYSDALDFKVTQPGRYTIYFAPDKTKVPDPAKGFAGTLDPTDSTCVFDFVVNQPPKAEFTATINSSGMIAIQDASIDPDSGKTTGETQVTDPNNPLQQVTGITHSWWRWEILASETVTGGIQELRTLASSNWEEWSDAKVQGGIHIRDLTLGHVTTEGRKSIYGAVNSGSGYYFANIPDGAVLTIYHKVDDISTVRRWNGSQYYYEPAPEKAVSTSKVIQQNATAVSGSSDPLQQVSYAPNAAFTATANVYDTAVGSSAKATIVRASRQTQKKDYNLSWELMIDNGSYITMTSEDGGKNWYATVPARNMTTGATSGTARRKVLEWAGAPGGKPTVTNGDATGTWTISQETLKYLLWTPGKTITLKMNEYLIGRPIEGYTEEEIANGVDKTGKTITGFTSRTITYAADKKAPTAQTVEVQTWTTTDNWATHSETEYEASKYLDVTQNDKKIVVKIYGSNDVEGEMVGYGYYFYDMDKNGNPTKYYSLNSDGTLKEQPNAAAAVGFKNGTRVGVLAGAGPHTIEITKAVIAEGRPIANLNFRVFAFDNQKNTTTVADGDVANLTGANETARTKVEKIKLAQFTPMPPAIKAADPLGQAVAEIGNDHAFEDVSGTDTVTGSGTANSNVTLYFTPRQDWFNVSGEDPVMLTEEEKAGKADSTLQAAGYMKYFVDTHKAADLTNKADLVVTITRNGQPYKNYTDYRMNYTENIPINDADGGTYEVTAYVINGSGSVSAPRSLSFYVDKDPPSPIPNVRFIYSVGAQAGKEYKTGWARAVTMIVSGSADRDPDAYYSYSVDNGVTWQPILYEQTDADGNVISSRRAKLSEDRDIKVEFDKTGTYNVRVKAVDSAGNETAYVPMTVKIDDQPPHITAPTLEVGSIPTEEYSEYVVSIAKSEGGTVYAVDGESNQDRLNTEILVPRETNKTFQLTPDEGLTVTGVSFAGQAIDLSKVVAVKNAAGEDTGVYEVTLEKVVTDGLLRVTFGEKPVTDGHSGYMAAARAASHNAVNTMKATNPQIYAPVDAATLRDVETVELIAESDGRGLAFVDNQFQATVEKGSNVEILFRPNEAKYTFKQATITYDDGSDPVTVTAADTTPGEVAGVCSYVVSNVQSGFTVYAEFEEKTAAVITAAMEGNGVITVADIGEATIDRQGNRVYNSFLGDTVKVDVVIEEEYELTSLKVNGEEKLETAATGAYSLLMDVTAEAMRIDAVVEMPTTGRNYRPVKVVIQPDPFTGQICGSVSPVAPTNLPTTLDDGSLEYSIPVKYNGAQTFLFKPNPACSVALKTIENTNSEDGPSGIPDSAFIRDENTGYYSYTIDKVDNGATKITVQFISNSYQLSQQVEVVNGKAGAEAEAGTVTVTANGKVLTNEDMLRIAEGTVLDISIQPNNGYRINNVVLARRGQDTADPEAVKGAVRSVSIPGIMSDYTLHVTYAKREYNRIISRHYLKATATNIYDEQDVLPEKPYSFKLNDGEWSEPLAEPTITYWDLDPNKTYTVSVRAVDSVGKVSSSETVLGENATAINTEANVPVLEDVQPKDEADNQVTKTVLVTVDPAGNPPETLYCVYYSEKPSMSVGRTMANLSPDSQHPVYYSRLDENNQLSVYHLKEGVRYYLQVVAVNGDNVSTKENNDNVLNILLPPTAPPECSMYFEEQTGPDGKIVLHWDAPGGELSGYAIYRDGMMIGTADNTTTSFEDNSYEQGTKGGVTADTKYVYSYAYINAAGIGSRTTAVSYPYYLANKKAQESEGENGEILPGDPADKNRLDSLKTTYNVPNVFTEVLTYPAFPAGFKRSYVQALSNDLDSGMMQLYIPVKTADVGRNEKFTVRVKAWINQGSLLHPDYVAVEDGTPYWDPTPGAGQSLAAMTREEITALAEEQGIPVWYVNDPDHTKETVSISAQGAQVTWTGLNTQWEYTVYVDKVASTGRRTYNSDGALIDGWQGEETADNTVQMETGLQKVFMVSESGYTYQYRVSDEVDTLLQPVKIGANNDPVLDENNKPTVVARPFVWAEDETEAALAARTYAGGRSWDSELLSLDSDPSSYVRFNKAPEASLPKIWEEQAVEGGEAGAVKWVATGYDNDAIYAGNDGSMITYDNVPYIQVDKSNNMKFKVTVNVWDPDGPAGNSNFEIKAAINGVNSNVVTRPVASELEDGSMSEGVTQTEREGLQVQLEFDGRKLSSGVYDSIDITVYDGQTRKTTTVTEGLKIIVNQSLPSISVVNKHGASVASKKIEKGYDYGTESSLTAAAKVTSNEAQQLRKARMIVLDQEYRKLFNNGAAFTDRADFAAAGSTYNVIKNLLQANDPTAVAAAKKLVGEARYNQLLSGGRLTDEGVDEVIDAVAPALVGYFQISKEQYDKINDPASADYRPGKTISTAAGDAVYYWVEVQTAFEHDETVAENQRWCSFLYRAAPDGETEKHYYVSKADGVEGTPGSPITYPVMLVATFGVNQTSTTLRFQVTAPPFMTIDSSKSWIWADATDAEYTAYKDANGVGNVGWTIGDVADRFATSYHVRPSESPYNFNEADLAYRENTDAGGKKSYEIFKLDDSRVDIHSNYVIGNVAVNTGMYDRIESAHVVFVNATYDDNHMPNPPVMPERPEGSSVPAASDTVKVFSVLGANDSVRLTTGTAKFRARNLSPGETYYIWLYYDVIDPETGETKTLCEQDYTAITTASDLYKSTSAFEIVSASFNEGGLGQNEAAIDSIDKVYTVVRDGDLYNTAVKLGLSIRYYRADQDGNILSEITPDDTEAYALASQTLYLNGDDHELLFNRTISSNSFSVHIENNNDKQGHMVAQISLSVKESIDGVNSLTKAGSVLSIFLIDDDSPTTSYKFGVDETEGLELMTDKFGQLTGEYEYRFPGLPYPYGSANTSVLALSLRNAGDDSGAGIGSLEEIEAELWDEDRSDKSKSPFIFSQQPTTSSLSAPVDDFAKLERCQFQIVAKEGLTDGVHTGWLRVTAKKVSVKDEVWIHLQQVVGQSTLKGRIYIGNAMPLSDQENVGPGAKVYIYGGSATSPGSGRPISGKPLYEAEVDPRGGTFEINNILNRSQYMADAGITNFNDAYYYIVVQRPGFVWYDSLTTSRRSSCRWVPTSSGVYEFNLQLKGGDVNGDQEITMEDYNELNEYLNSVYDIGGTTEKDQKLATMDYNCDGGVNAIDRMILWGNRGKKVSSLYPATVPKKIASAVE